MSAHRVNLLVNKCFTVGVPCDCNEFQILFKAVWTDRSHLFHILCNHRDMLVKSCAEWWYFCVKILWVLVRNVCEKYVKVWKVCEKCVKSMWKMCDCLKEKHGWWNDSELFAVRAVLRELFVYLLWIICGRFVNGSSRIAKCLWNGCESTVIAMIILGVTFVKSESNTWKHCEYIVKCGHFVDSIANRWWTVNCDAFFHIDCSRTKFIVNTMFPTLIIITHGHAVITNVARVLYICVSSQKSLIIFHKIFHRLDDSQRLSFLKNLNFLRRRISTTIHRHHHN